MRQQKGYNPEDYDVLYSGGTIDRVKAVVNVETGEVKYFNAVHLPENPYSARIPKHKDFIKTFGENMTALQRANVLSAYDMYIFSVMTLYITWESNVIYDKDTQAYLTATDIARMLGKGRKAVDLSINRMHEYGIIALFRGNKNERRILLHPYLVYKGEKIDKWVLDLFESKEYKPPVRIPFPLKVYIDTDGQETFYPAHILCAKRSEAERLTIRDKESHVPENSDSSAPIEANDVNLKESLGLFKRVSETHLEIDDTVGIDDTEEIEDTAFASDFDIQEAPEIVALQKQIHKCVMEGNYREADRLNRELSRIRQSIRI